MKKFLPLVAVVGLLAACGNPDGYCENCDHHKHKKDWSRDSLSDRPMGSSRDTHGAYVGNGEQARIHHHPHHPGHVHGDKYVVAPVAPAVIAPATDARAIVRPDGTYYVRPDGTYYTRADGTYYVTPIVEDHGKKHEKWEDPLSERSLGNSRGSHNQPMTNKDHDNDGTYDYVPDYRLRGYQWRYSQ